MVAKRLGDAAKTFTAHRNHCFAGLLGLCSGHSLNIVANKTDRAFRLNGYSFAHGEQALEFVDTRRELLVAAEDDVLFLKVRREMHWSRRCLPRWCQCNSCAVRHGSSGRS